MYHVPALDCSSFNRFSRLTVTNSMTNCTKKASLYMRSRVCRLCNFTWQWPRIVEDILLEKISHRFLDFLFLSNFKLFSFSPFSSHKQVHCKEARLYVCLDKFKAKAKVIQVAKRETHGGGVAGNPPSVCQHFVSYFLLLSLCFASFRLFRH